MFNPNSSFEARLAAWAEMREEIADSEDPIQATIDYYSQAPEVSIHTDPYDRDTWPTPWELIQENLYCGFCRLLGIAYTLQLTDCFSDEQFEIHIQRSRETGEIYYLLYVGDRVVGYTGETHVAKSDIPNTHDLQHRYNLSL